MRLNGQLTQIERKVDNFCITSDTKQNCDNNDCFLTGFLNTSCISGSSTETQLKKPPVLTKAENLGVTKA